MKFRSVLGLTISGLLVGTAAFAVEACGGDDSPAPAPSKVLPTQPVAVAPTPTDARHTFAIQNIFLGDTDRAGVVDSSAWRLYGYNIDEKETTRSSTDVCSSAEGASNAVQVDGENGLDNSFGLNILPILLANENTVQGMNQQIHAGGYTLMIDTKGLTPEPNQNNIGLAGQIFSGAAFSDAGAKPTFSLADNWPVTREDLADGTSLAGGSRVKFTSAWVKDGLFVGTADPLLITLGMNGVQLDLVLHKATLSFSHTSPNAADNGTIAGVVNTNELIASVRKIVGRINLSYCQKDAFDVLSMLIRNASDIMTDGSNRPGVKCDAISMGLGFNAKEIQPPSTVAPPAPPPVDSCAPRIADAGTD